VELKRSIRTQTLDTLVIEKEMLSEALVGSPDHQAGSQPDLLPTQPQRSYLPGYGQADERYERLEEDEANKSGPVTIPAPAAVPAPVNEVVPVVPVVPDSANDEVEFEETSIAESSASAQKRRYDSIVAMTRGEVGEVESPMRNGYGWSGKKKRVQRPPNKGPKNPYLGHPWDCTRLVPRYAHAEQVPKDLKKCAWSFGA
jgi:trimethylguanosine synthase